MLHANINVKGIYTVNGDVFSRACIAKHLVSLFGKNIPVSMGDAQPLGGTVQPYTHFENCYVDDSFIDDQKSDEEHDIIFKKPQKVDIYSHGLKKLASQVSGNYFLRPLKKIFKTQTTLFSLGPLTTLAHLLENYPSSLDLIDQIYVMGCRFGESPSLEHNVRFDIPAAIQVFESQVPLTIIPGDLCSRYHMSVELLEQLQTPAGLYVKRMAKSFIGEQIAAKLALEDLISLIDEGTRDFQKISSLSRSEKDIFLRKRKDLFREIDDLFFAAQEPQKFFTQYQQLIEHLRDPKIDYQRGPAYASLLEQLIPKALSIADVYVPYCYLHPERITTEKAFVRIDEHGYSYKEQGDKHTLVTDLDFDHFKTFLKTYLK